jgi:hypothetical protein
MRGNCLHPDRKNAEKSKILALPMEKARNRALSGTNAPRRAIAKSVNAESSVGYSGGCSFSPDISLVEVVNVCSILFSLKLFIKNGFLGKKLMFILADFRKSNTCGDNLETRIYRKY